MTDSSSLCASPADDAASALILGATLDSLVTQIAILDAQGVIIAVNAAWGRFAQSNGFDSHNAGVGLNYLDVCA
ncbi:MAG: histidine kinase, partial [Armatimonadetes bacterium]|nr:histidine kinase [Armatimonadota bacterium]